MNKKIFLTILIVAVFIASAYFFVEKEKETEFLGEKNIEKTKEPEVVQEVSAVNTKEEPEKTIASEKRAIPFTSQAPTGDWSDDRFQNGCEEASVAMAMRWIKGEEFTSPEDAKREIFDLAKYEEKTFGNHVDASIEDVGKILSGYYSFKNHSVVHGIDIENIKKELAKGNILIVPVFGQALKNPNFKQPGPVTHMLVVLGWDSAAKKFITNDPGTKNGKGYAYDEKILFDAIWEYPTGKIHPKIPKSEKMEKGIIVIRPEQKSL